MLKVMNNPITLKPLKPIGKILQNIGNIQVRHGSANAVEQVRKIDVSKNSDKNEQEVPIAVISATIAEVLSYIQLGKVQFDTLVTNLLEHCRAVPQVSFKYVAPSYAGKFSSINNNIFSIDMRHFIKTRQNSLLSSQVNQIGYRFNIPTTNDVKKIILSLNNFYIQINDVKYYSFMGSDLIQVTQQEMSNQNMGQLQLLTNQKIYNSGIEPLCKLMLQVLKQNVSKCFIEYQGDIQIYHLLKQLFDHTDYFIQMKHFIQEINSKDILNVQSNVLYISLQNDKIIVGDQYIELQYNCSSIINCLIENQNLLFPLQDNENNNILKIYQRFYVNFVKEIKNLQHDIDVFTIEKDKININYEDDNQNQVGQNMNDRYYEQQQLFDDIFQNINLDYIEVDKTVHVIFDTKHYVQQYHKAISQLPSLKHIFANKDVIVTGEMLAFPIIKTRANEALRPFAGLCKSIKITK